MATIGSKIKRLREGNPPRVLDLFCGCGGFSIGIKSAGAIPVAGIDHDWDAMRNWYFNLCPDRYPFLERTMAADISEAEPQSILSSFGINDFSGEIDVVCGGPPCQAYSKVGRGKLRSIHGEGAHLEDKRGGLYSDLLRFVETVIPVAVIVENVTDSLDYGGRNIPNELCIALKDLGYVAIWTILDAAAYGTPQYRERVIVMALHEHVGVNPIPPAPSHFSIRQAQGRKPRYAMRSDGSDSFFIPVFPGTECLPPAVSVADAIGDLPVISTLDADFNKNSHRDVQTLKPYSLSIPATPYQELMRSWPGFDTGGWVTGNAIRHTPRDFPIFSRMVGGDLYPDATRIAHESSVAAISEIENRAGRPLSRQEIAEIRGGIVPPYDSTKFLNKWEKLKQHSPSHTILAHLQIDTYSHIHYDSTQARGISVREAARLQSIPDGYKFLGSMKNSFQQIGNAVPPLLAKAIMDGLMKCIVTKQTKIFIQDM